MHALPGLTHSALAQEVRKLRLFELGLGLKVLSMLERKCLMKRKSTFGLITYEVICAVLVK